VLDVNDLINQGLTTPNRVENAKKITVQVKEHYGTLFYAEFVDEKGRNHTCMLDVESGKRDCDCRDFKFRKGEVFCSHIIALLKTVTEEELKKMSENKEEGEPSKPSDFITTGCEGIDILLGGGLPKRAITLCYAPYNVGKSLLGMQCAASVYYNTGKPALIINTEDDWVLEEDRVRVLSWFQKRWNKTELPKIDFLFLPDIYDLMKFFGKQLELDVTEEAHQIVAKVYPLQDPHHSPCYLLCQEKQYGIIILDSISSPLKDEISTPPRENFPARAVILNNILGRLRRCVVDLNVPGYVTAHATTAPGPTRDQDQSRPYAPSSMGFHIKRILGMKGSSRSEDRIFTRFRGPGLAVIERPIKLKRDTGFVDYETGSGETKVS